MTEAFAYVETCKLCGSTDIMEDPEHGCNVCCDCGTESSSILDHRDDNYTSLGNGESYKVSRCGAPISDLCPNAGSHFIIGKGSSQKQRWGMISYPERKILELKKKLETYAATKFNQAVLDDAIRLTKIARIDSPNRKNMDMAFLAAGCYYSCSTRSMPKTLTEIKEEFGISTKEDIRHLTDALRIIENIIIQKKYTIKINTEDGYIDDSGIPLARAICETLELPPWATESILLILHKFYEKNILQNIIIKNKIGVVILFVFRYGKITNIPIALVLKQIGSSSIATIAKHCHTITHNYFDGVMKYINKKRIKYGLEPSKEVPAIDAIAASAAKRSPGPM